VAAILRRGKSVIKIGVNSDKTHPFALRFFHNGWAASLHAEMVVLLASEPGDIIEVLRVNKFGLCMAKPCEHCMKRILEKRISEVRYTDENGEWQTMKLKYNN
jgi:deoxycytidylate deaminase